MSDVRRHRTAVDGRSIVVTGDIAPIPLPAALPLLALALGGHGIAHRGA